MARVEFRFLNRSQLRSLLPPPSRLLAIVEDGLKAHGRGEVVLPPKALSISITAITAISTFFPAGPARSTWPVSR